MKHIKLFENWINEASGLFTDSEKKKVTEWLDSVESFVNTVRDEQLSGKIDGFPDKESQQPLAKLVYGEDFDLESPPDLTPYEDDPDECISWYLRVYSPDAPIGKVKYTRENMYGTFVSPEVEDRMMKSYKEMVDARKRLGRSLIFKLVELMDADDKTAEYLQFIPYDYGRFMWDDPKDPEPEGECTPSKLRKFLEEKF
jgi:hypothetical protein